MASKLMKKYSTSFIIRKLEMKIIIKYYHTSIEWLKLKRLTILRVDKDAEKLDPSYIAGENIKCHSHFK